jgi:hypothetical protein
MPLNWQLNEHAVAIIVSGVLGLLAILFFVVVYVADFREKRQDTKRKREREQSSGRTQRARGPKSFL